MSDADAIVVGSGPNGLVAANVLADAGWSVIVAEAQAQPGGAVRSDEILPGYVTDRFSSFYPFAVASPVMQALCLERHGLRWIHPRYPLAHPFPDGTCARISTDPLETAAGLDEFHRGDGAMWIELLENWRKISGALIDGLIGTTFPPVRASMRLAAKLGPRGLADLARTSILPVRRLTEERFGGVGGQMLLAGSAFHADLSPEAPLSGFYGWMLAMLGQQWSFPVPEGGAGQLTDALVRRLESRGGRIECDTEVTSIIVRRGRAHGVATQRGDLIAGRAVLADVDAPRLFNELVGSKHLPARFTDDLRRFHRDPGTFKVDWALSGPVPWTAEKAYGSAAVHISDDINHVTSVNAQLAAGLIPDRPFLVLGQMTTADPSRSPHGTETLWGYTHIPTAVRGDNGGSLTGRWDHDEVRRFADRIEAQIESRAPGFQNLISARRILASPDLERSNANLVGGSINGGTSALHQQLFFRPVPGTGRPTTPIKDLYLASASAHPGGGVHGACGANAARSAIFARRRRAALKVAGGAAALAMAARRRHG